MRFWRIDLRAAKEFDDIFKLCDLLLELSCMDRLGFEGFNLVKEFGLFCGDIVD